jgi:hypothetical protein
MMDKETNTEPKIQKYFQFWMSIYLILIALHPSTLKINLNVQIFTLLSWRYNQLLIRAWWQSSVWYSLSWLRRVRLPLTLTTLSAHLVFTSLIWNKGKALVACRKKLKKIIVDFHVDFFYLKTWFDQNKNRRSWSRTYLFHLKR